jgi:hypothetical protein
VATSRAGSSPAFGTNLYIYYQRVMLMHNPFFVGHWLVRQPTGEISWYGRAFSNGKSLQWQIATTAYAKILLDLSSSVLLNVVAHRLSGPPHVVKDKSIYVTARARKCLK